MTAALAEWTWRVEAGKIAEFARAVGSPYPEVAAPTFTMAAGAEAVERLVADVLHLDRARTVHGEQAFAFLAPVRAGMMLAARADLVSETVKLGSGGAMRVLVVATTYGDAATGTVLVRETMTMIEKAESATPPHPGPEHPQGEREVPDNPRDADGTVVFGPVTRTDLVRYAGASGDFNPLHHDAGFARTAGLPDVMAHGMYSAGLVASHLQRWFGAEALSRYAVRFRRPVWPGDRPVLHLDTRDGGDLTLSLRRGAEVVLSATATIIPSTGAP
jgi:3-hydroxybutyryl-CoA dehydratase